MSDTEEGVACPTCGRDGFHIPPVVRVKAGAGLMRHAGREPKFCTCPEGPHFVAGCCEACRHALALGRGALA